MDLHALAALGAAAEVGLKPQLSPRDCVTKEEELKSLLADEQTEELHLR